MKRILTIQDISCVGKCSLTVALPIISAAGVEAAIIPTAVLSTHTMFKNFTCKDLDDQILPIAKHWKDEGITFDAFYTGYLANAAFPKEMAKLCAKADIVLPNITEACFLTDTEYREEYDEAFAKYVVKKLAAQGAKKVVLTGAAFDGSYGVLVYDSETDEFYNYQQEKIDAAFHGTGDIFSSAFTGSLVRGKSLEESVKIAADYTAECIRITKASPNANWYGVDFERAIPFLLKLLEA